MAKDQNFSEKLEREYRLRANELSELGMLVTKDSHPSFMRNIDALHAKVFTSIKHRFPHIIITKESPIGPIWMRKIPEAAAFPEYNAIVISQPMMDLAGSSLERPMSPMLENIMVHEFSHLKDGAAHLLAGRMLPWALPVVAMASLHLYDRAREKAVLKSGQTKKDYYQALVDNIYKTAEVEITGYNAQAATRQDWHIHPTWQENTINAGRYALAAAIGFGAGLLGTRFHARNAEFRADKMAVDIVGKPQAFKEYFREAEKIWENAEKNRTPPDNIFEEIKDWWNTLMSQTISAHPSDKERITYIDRLIQEKAAAQSAATTHLL